MPTPGQSTWNPSLQAHRGQKLVLAEAPIRTPGPGEALIHVKATGVCGSDVHLWQHGGLGPVTLHENHVLGHEGAGVVLKVHADVSHLCPGDRVAIEPLSPCGICIACTGGHRNLCDNSILRGVYGPPGQVDGTCQRYMVHPAKLLHPLPDNMTFQQGALLEPLSVSLQATRNANLRLGAPVLVCGAGPIGLLALACARAAGACPVVITDLEPKRLEFARDFVPQVETFQVNPSKSPEETASELQRLFLRATQSRLGSDGSETEAVAPVSVLECTGFSSSIVTGCHVVRKTGTVMVIGAGQPILDGIPASLLMTKQITLKSSRTYVDTWPAGINLISAGLINLDKFVTHTFPLEKAVEALQTASDPSKGSIKVQVIDEMEI